MSDIILRLRQHRTRHGLSQEELARRVGVSRQALIAIERGASRPSLPVVLAIMRVLDLPFQELFEREGFRLQAQTNQTKSSEQSVIPLTNHCFPIPFNLFDTGTALLVEADLAGVKEEDVIIDVGISHIVLSATRQATDRSHLAITETIPSGQLLRILALPEPINPDLAEATLRNGLLRLTLPKNNGAVRRTIRLKKENHGSK
jgi:HSP20 family molecular chaperone IbpA